MNDPKNPNTISDNRIRAICEDDSGYIWIGTFGGGLNRFERKTEKFKNFKFTDNTLRGFNYNRIHTVLLDRSGTLWIGTGQGYLQRFDSETGTFKTYEYTDIKSDSLEVNAATAIYEDISGSLWIGYLASGICRFNRETEEFTNYKNEPGNSNSLSGNYIRCITGDSSGNLWIGTDFSGLNKFDMGKETFKLYKNDPGNNSINSNSILSFSKWNTGEIWIGTNGGGLNKFDPETEKFKSYIHSSDNPDGLSNNSILSVFIDNSNVIWAGTYAGGINKAYNDEKRFEVIKNNPGDLNSLNSNIIFSIYEDSVENVWIGTNEGLNIFDRRKNRYILYRKNSNNPNSLSNNIVRVIYKDRAGNMWLGTDDGLNKFNLADENFTVYKNEPGNINSLSYNIVRSITEDKDGLLWIGTNRGLSVLDAGSETFKYTELEETNPDKISSCPVRMLYCDRSGTMWMATNRGLREFNYDTKQFKLYINNPDDSTSISANSVYCICEDKSGLLLIGTKNGLNILNRGTGSFKRFTTREGLINNTIYCIIEDLLGDFWLSTDAGISKVHKEFKKEDSDPQSRNFRLKFRNYGLSDGLQGNEFNSGAYFKSSRGDLYFGGMNGLNVFNPAMIRKDNTYIPPVAFTDLKIFSQTISAGEKIGGEIILRESITEAGEINLPYNRNYISIKFAALDYTNSEKNEYAYKIEDVSIEWSKIGPKRDIDFNFTPGEYNLCVKGSNSDGIWNETGNSLKIIVNPPYWETLWFRITATLIVFILIITVHKTRTRSIKKKNILLNEQINERKRAEYEIKQLRNYLSNIIDSMPSILIGVDMEGKVTQWNIEAEKATGIKAGDAHKKPLNEVYPQYKSEMKKVHEAIRTNKIQTDSKVTREVNGETLYLEITVYPLTANGTEGAVIRIDDITERIKIEEMMIQSEKMLSLGGMAAGMAHEINNPLAGIIQNSQVLQNRISEKLKKNKQVAEECGLSFETMIDYIHKRGIDDMIKSIYESGSRAALIVENMLNFSRKSDSIKIDCDINDLINKTINLAANDYDLKKKYDFRQIEIVTEYSEKMPYIPCQGNKIQQVVLNLLKNSAHEMRKLKSRKKPKINIRTYIKDNKAFIEVEDNGPGMTEAVRKRLFEPFFTTKGVGEGTGLGLSISYFIIKENHNGEMSVVSNPGKGTKFTISIPVGTETPGTFSRD